jgi:tRNA G10  N-methylase Trm11
MRKILDFCILRVMATFSYIAVLGRQPEFGLVELESVLGAEAVRPFGRQAVLLDREVDVNALGGVVKAARVLYEGPAVGIRPVPVDVDALPMGDGKTPFALSVYGLRATQALVVAGGLALKKQLAARGSARFIAPSEGLAVSAAQLTHNNVLERGFELVIVVAGSRMVVAQTVGVQDIDWFSRRDYGRPARSARVGMLPPKLARVLVNTTTAPVVVDPFCGTGVVLQEALLAGRSAVGSDLSEEMVAASRQNLQWLAGVAPGPVGAWQADEADARTVRLPDAALAVVTEGYLGPHLTASPTPSQLRQIRADLLELYRGALANWGRQLEPGAELALCVPAWRIGQDWQYLGVVDELPRLGYTMKVLKHVWQPLLYARPDQVVGRQIVLLRKQ